MATVLTFLSSSFFSVTSSVSASIQVWGPGGNGATNRGGSGGAYVTGSIQLVANNVYSCSIGTPLTASGVTSDFLLLSSSFISGSGGNIFFSAIGGSNTGDIAHQLTSGAVSGSNGTYYQGGTSIVDSVGTENYNGSGGGASGGLSGSGAAGSSPNGLGRTGAGAVAAPGGTGIGGGGSGGNGAYYDSNRAAIIPHQNGSQPGGGGGGIYATTPGIGGNPYAVVANAIPPSLGGAGQITVTF